MTRGRVAIVAGVVAVACVLLPGRPAAADPPEPTDFRSTVTATEPSLPPGIEVRVVGGDGFLELRNDGPATVVVPDYSEGPDGEAVPYLRFQPDGTVERNARADATLLNESRYGTGAPGDGGAAPEWEVVATGGTYAWHDHRIHWMSPTVPATDDGGRVDMGGPDGRWEVPILVDGDEVQVQGSLELLDSPSPLPWIAAIALLAAAIVVVGRSASPQIPLLVAGASGALALSLAWNQWAAAPAGSGATPLGVVVTAAALVAAVVALVADRTPWPTTARLLASSATAAALLGWGALRWDVFTHAVLPTTLAPWVDRGITALALAAGLAVAAALVLPSRVRASRSA